MSFPLLDPELREARLTPPEVSAEAGRLRTVLDTDTYNEVDDQFALAQAMLAPDRLEVEAICAAPFFNDRSNGPADGMKRSYDEILRLLDMLGTSPDGLVFEGSETYLPGRDEPVESAAARRIVDLARRPDPRPLYVVAIGAITNVASALLLDPEIVEKIVVVWLGGREVYHESAREFNLRQDVPAAQVVFDCGVPLVHIPCHNVTSHLITTVPELEQYLAGKGRLADYLVEIVRGYGSGEAYSKVIWDIAATSWMICPDWVPTRLIPSPILNDDATWSQGEGRHPVRTARAVKRDAIFADVFRRLAGAG